MLHSPPTAAAPRPWRRVLAGALIALAAGGCAIGPRIDLAAIAPEPTRLDAVPFFAQTDYQCGPAALAGVLGAAGVDATPDTLAPQVYLPGRQGSLQVELLAATRRAGRLPYVVEGTPEALLAELRAGRPVLVLQNLRTRGFPVWHYAVVVGHDPARGRVVLNSGTRRGMAMPAASFMRTWDWAGRWAMVALVPGELPARADPRRYAEAVAAFEPVAGTRDAAIAWRAALREWPGDPYPWLGLGNLAHAGGDLEEAARHFSQGLALAAGDVVLANNLASVLGELGCPRTGERVLRPLADMLAGDAPWREAVRATLAELDARAGEDPARCRDLLRRP